MSDTVRLLTPEGVDAFRLYLQQLRASPSAPVPEHLLVDPGTSSEAPFTAVIEHMPGGDNFSDRHEFGMYLVGALATADRGAISRNHGLWTWLALYYFDQLCPLRSGGLRKPLKDDAAYLLDAEFSYTRYYRHLVRTPWLAVLLHPVTSRVILTPSSAVEAPLAQRGELIEQLASRQNLFRSPTVMATAYSLYYDSERNRSRKGSGGSGAGSSRRLAAILNQLDLTYDLEWQTSDMIISRLPKEFARWK